MKPAATLSALNLALAASLAIAIAAPAAAAKGYYTWKDANGTTHYATTPPVGADSQSHRFGPARDIHTTYVKPEPSAAPDPASKTDAAPEQSTQPTATETAATPEIYSKDPERCAHARRNLETLSSQRPIRATDAEGNKRLLSPEDRQQQRALAQEIVSVHC